MTQTEIPEAVTPEIVEHPEASTALATTSTADAANALIEKAAEHALMPGVPGRDEFVTLAMTARILAMSGAAPKAVRNNPYVAFHVAMVGRDLGISPSASLELIDIIDGHNGPQLSLSPQLLNGQVERLGLGHIVPAYRGTDRAVAVAVGPGGHVDPRCGRSWPEHAEGCDCRKVIGDSEFTWEDARMAGLVGPGCEPGTHDKSIKKGRGDSTYYVCGCNQGYITYPKRMMWWRAAGFCADDWFPTASMGLYSPEALGATVDEEGRPIDPSSVRLPEGYEPKAPEPVEQITFEERNDLTLRIAALPAAARPALAERWTSKNDAGEVYLAPLARLPKRQLAKARALVTHVEDRAKGGEWGDWTPPTAPPADPAPTGGDGSATETPAETPQEPSAPDTAPEPPSAPSEATAADPVESEVCPACKGTETADGEPCWGCSGASGVCEWCKTRDHDRLITNDGHVRCVDEDACWEREQALGSPAAQVVQSTDVTPLAPTAPDVEACSLCGSTRAQLVDVQGVLRCGNATACKGRQAGKSGVELARAALGDKA